MRDHGWLRCRSSRIVEIEGKSYPARCERRIHLRGEHTAMVVVKSARPPWTMHTWSRRHER